MSFSVSIPKFHKGRQLSDRLRQRLWISRKEAELREAALVVKVEAADVRVEAIERLFDELTEAFEDLARSNSEKDQRIQRLKEQVRRLQRDQLQTQEMLPGTSLTGIGGLGRNTIAEEMRRMAALRSDISEVTSGSHRH